jgi:hypothetical protein
MISIIRSLVRPAQSMRKIISILYSRVTATTYQPERHYMRGGR